MDQAVRLWNVTDRDPQKSMIEFVGHHHGCCAAFSRDGRWLFTGAEIGSSDTVGRLWDLTAKQPNAHPILLKGVDPKACDAQSACFSGDGRWLVIVGRSATTLCDLQVLDDGGLGRRIPRHMLNPPAACFTPDSKRLVTMRGESACLWDLTAEDPTLEPVQLNGPSSSMLNCAVVSADGKSLVTAGALAHDGVRVWRMQMDDVIAAARRAAGRDFTDEERAIFRIPR
jgi:WD40 repeat protein